MSNKFALWAGRYATALGHHLQQARGTSLQPADRLGHQALAGGLETLDLARIHERALVTLVSPRYTGTARNGLLKKAETFFIEAITPIEENHRAMREANARLLQVNRALRQRTVELAAANRRLQREIVQRQAAEVALKQSQQHSSQLLEQSRRMQEQLRQLSHQLLRAQEEERKQISRELHDDIAQTLTGINVHLAALKTEAAANANGLKKRISRTQQLVEQSVNIVHRFARELRPTVLDDLGLIPALQSFMTGFTKRTGIHIRFTAFARVERLDSAKRTVLYRVVQSALSNVAQHAHASQVKVSIRKQAAAVHLAIEDDGRGFELDRVLFRRHNRLGLLGMRERVEMVGGSFTVESAPGQGTTIRAQIPFNRSHRV